jgi:D-sedoheptulose 7-phosphate isomerase
MSRIFQVIEEQIDEALEVHSSLVGDKSIAQSIERLAELCSLSLSKGGTVFFAGNGGSFADAQHMAAELTGKMGRTRRSLSGIALGTNSSSMSAIGNDFGYELAFARELEGLHRAHSVVVAFSTSGNSANLLELAKVARKLEIPMVCLTGKTGGKISDHCEVIRLPSNRTERIQELQTLLGHTLCLCIEEILELSSEPYGA